MTGIFVAIAPMACVAPEGGPRPTENAQLRASPELRLSAHEALRRAAQYLVQAQSADGQWESGVYGGLKNDPALTAHVLTTLYLLRDLDPQAGEAVRRGMQVLAPWPQAPVQRLAYPVYTSSAAAWLMALPERATDDELPRQFWLQRVLEHQLDERNGWRPSDPQFGGWGYAPRVPRRDDGDVLQPFALDSNISATVYGLGALRLAGHDLSRAEVDRRLKAALAFVQRCQNFDPANPTAEDGGFFFSPTDPARNKAGEANAPDSGDTDHGSARFNSYGSATADGIRCLLACGLPRTDPRVEAAANWLRAHFSGEQNPGHFPQEREVIRNAYYFYYTWSVAHALRRLEIDEIPQDGRRVNWRDELIRALVRRQNPDGSWFNEFSDARENDPLVATPFAAAALLLCVDDAVHHGRRAELPPR